MKVVLANPRGFCAGVDRAIEIVKKVIKLKGSPIYIKHEVVHNQTVVKELKELGAIFVEEISDIPRGASAIFSAHGVSKEVAQDSELKNLDVFDATCPLVSKVHAEVQLHSKSGKECILIGHAHHPEVEGTLGQYDTINGGAIYLVQSKEEAERQRKADEAARTVGSY